MRDCQVWEPTMCMFYPINYSGYASSPLMMPGHLLEVEHRGDDSRQSYSGLFAWLVVRGIIYVY